MTNKETKFNIGDKVFVRDTTWKDNFFHLERGVIEKISKIQDKEGFKITFFLKDDQNLRERMEKYTYKTIEEAMEAFKEWSKE